MCLNVESKIELKYPKLSKIPGLKWLKKHKALGAEFKIAEKNILVYKYVKFIDKNLCESIFHDYLYIINYEDHPRIKIRLDPRGFYNFRIREGYHSRLYYKKEYCFNDIVRFNNALFIIPKGTRYITGLENDNDNIIGAVSEKIIYKGYYSNKEEHDNLLEKLIQEYGDALEIQNET